MGAAQPITKYSLAEYLAFEERSEGKHEYFAGEIFAMAEAGPAHNQICFRLTGLLARQLESCKGAGYSSDQKIWIEAAGLNTYADLTIVCGQPQYDSEYPNLLTNPNVIIEVLSPSTMSYDRGEKWSFYQQLSSLTDYLLVWQDCSQIEHFSLQADGSWRYVRTVGLEQTVTIASIHGQLSLADVYSGIEFPPPPSPRPPIQIVSE